MFKNKEYGLGYYLILGTLSALVPLPLFYAGYLCVKADEYWPLVLFVAITYFAWLTAISMFRNVRRIRNEGPKSNI